MATKAFGEDEMATPSAMTEKVKESTVEDEKDAKQWLLPVWRDSIVWVRFPDSWLGTHP